MMTLLHAAHLVLIGFLFGFGAAVGLSLYFALSDLYTVTVYRWRTPV